MACLMGKVTGAMITGIAADVHRYRATPPTIANTDGDPMCLITAAIAVAEGTIGKLVACPDFDLDIDEPDRGTWWGRADPRRPARGEDGRGQGAVASPGPQGCRSAQRSAALGARCAAGP
jgi:hypothetical protein